MLNLCGGGLAASSSSSPSSAGMETSGVLTDACACVLSVVFSFYKAVGQGFHFLLITGLSCEFRGSSVSFFRVSRCNSLPFFSFFVFTHFFFYATEQVVRKEKRCGSFKALICFLFLSFNQHCTRVRERIPPRSSQK